MYARSGNSRSSLFRQILLIKYTNVNLIRADDILSDISFCIRIQSRSDFQNVNRSLVF